MRKGSFGRRSKRPEREKPNGKYEKSVEGSDTSVMRRWVDGCFKVIFTERRTFKFRSHRKTARYYRYRRKTVVTACRREKANAKHKSKRTTFAGSAPTHGPSHSDPRCHLPQPRPGSLHTITLCRPGSSTHLQRTCAPLDRARPCTLHCVYVRHTPKRSCSTSTRDDRCATALRCATARPCVRRHLCSTMKPATLLISVLSLATAGVEAVALSPPTDCLSTAGSASARRIKSASSKRGCASSFQSRARAEVRRRFDSAQMATFTLTNPASHTLSLPTPTAKSARPGSRSATQPAPSAPPHRRASKYKVPFVFAAIEYVVCACASYQAPLVMNKSTTELKIIRQLQTA